MKDTSTKSVAIFAMIISLISFGLTIQKKLAQIPYKKFEIHNCYSFCSFLLLYHITVNISIDLADKSRVMACLSKVKQRRCRSEV